MRKTDQNKDRSKGDARRLSLALMVFLIALASIAVATLAWFSASSKGEVDSMDFNITSGISLKFDLDAHQSVDQYASSLSFTQISSRMEAEHGYNMMTSPLVPVTTTDATVFTYEDGTPSSENSGEYLTFTLHFMGEADQVVHLSSSSGEDGTPGTVITSQKDSLPDAMRISFTTDEGTWIYDRGLGDTSTSNGNVKTFGLAEGGSVNNDNNAMFSLKANTDKAAVVHVWIEGNDENCVNEVKGSDYAIALKFEGTDTDNGPVKSKTDSETTNQSGNNQNNQTGNQNNPSNTQRERDIFDKISDAWNSIMEKHQ